MSDKLLAMSDEDFLKLNEPPAVEAKTEPETQPTAEEQAAAAAAQAEADAAAKTTSEQKPADGQESSQDTDPGTATDETPGEDGEPAKKDGEQDSKPAAASEGQPSGQEDKGPKKGDTKDDSSPGSLAADEGSPPNYEEFYKSIMTPLNANGKTIELRTPEEARQLMRMGANYTRKMQDLAPKRKILMMLENNGLLDESQLSFAIDLVKKDPQAIKKLLKDANIDPLDIDVKSDPTYREGNHRVTDEEATFVTTLDDIQSTPEGTETLKLINTQWDQASKEVLMRSPEVMEVIHEQRVSGVYGRVTAEVERLRTLGAISSKMPFLQAYKEVGDALGKSGALNDLAPSKPQVQTPVAQTAAKPKPVIKNSDKARAAAATQSTPKTAESKVNPLSLSDEAFMKQMADRL